MKNNPILNPYKLSMIVMTIIMQLSCQQGESYNLPLDSALIKLSVSASNNEATAVSNDPASVVKSLCILQFNASGINSGTLRHVGIGKEIAPNSGKYSAALLQSVDANDKYKLIVLANFPEGYGIFQSMGNKSYDEIQQLCLSEEFSGTNNVPVFDTDYPFPMFGLAENGGPIFINETMNFGPVSLVRAVARVDIGVGTKNPDDNTWDKGDVNFNMTQIQIWKAGKQYAYMPAENNFSSQAGILTILNPSPAGTTETKVYDNTYITNATYCSEKIYLPESDLQWGNVYDTDHTNRLALIVGGRYNGSPTERFYRVDFINDQTGEKINILRNHIYQFSIKDVTDEGYDTAEEAYNSTPKGLSFTTSIDSWQTGINAKPLPQKGYLMAYGSQNGTITTGEGITIKKKSPYWEGENNSVPVAVDYNTFYGEVPGNLKRSPAYPNGDIYPDQPTLTRVEGAYPLLMVATDDIYNITGSSIVHWKDGLEFTAFDLCRSYSGLGFSDWRLPRASELALMYLNRQSLEKQRGFTAFSGTYWSGSEKGAPTLSVAPEAWIVNFDASPILSGGDKISDSYKIRCVRQVSNFKK